MGAPLRHGNRLYNCAVVIHRGQVLGVVPKSNLPNYREFYEKRWFASGDDLPTSVLDRPHWPGADEDGEIPFGTDLLFEADDVPGWPSTSRSARTCGCRSRRARRAALAGATVLLNLSASPITVGPRRGPAPARPLRELAVQRRLPVCRRVSR